MTRFRPASALTLVITVGVSSLAVGAELPPHVYLLARGQSAFWEIDTASGDRRLLELADYPRVLALSQAVVTPTGELLFTASNAAQQHAVFAFNPATGGRTGVSGPIDGYGEVVRGQGPPLQPLTNGLALAPWGGLYVLRALQGPIHVSVATGDRAVVSQSAEPAVGAGHPLSRPIDIVLETAGSLLVMDEYEGLVRVRLADGARALAYPSTLFIEPPYRFDRLPDGRIVHLVPGTDALFVFDPRTGSDAPLSGRGRGAGPAFGALADVAVTTDGAAIVIGVAPSTVFAVDLTTGDRTVISGAGRGAGEELPTGDDRPTLAGFAAGELPPGVPPRPVRRRLQTGTD